MTEKKIVGIVEEVEVRGRESIKKLALFDTGAKTTSIDVRLAAQAQLGPIVKTSKVSNPSVKRHFRRPVVRVKLKIRGKVFETLANIQDRDHMTFPILIGRNIISGNFIVDTKRNYEIYERERDARGKQAQVRQD
jgi:hypothetical protein